ncbi:MAG: hypothetical protein JXR52_05815 [Bacteroidales bacterium]|nr:hypothetical protein [Bacteroidales bacterium]MBN2698324.1 hypothetical protein [Bacteroidales bacterium]
MRVFWIKQILLIILVLVLLDLRAQDEAYDDLLRRIDTIENPVYKPVVALSYGVLNFRGDVRNQYVSPVIGTPAFRVNIATFADRRQFFTVNFNFLKGRLNGSQYDFSMPEKNLNFQTDLFSFGVSLEYRFGHLVSSKFPVRPYVSLGIENIYYSAKGDLMDAAGRTYYYWTDGSIRDRGEDAPGEAGLLFRDYSYETDLRKYEQDEYGLGDYNQMSLSLPVEAGLHFKVHERVFLNLGVGVHHTFSDYLDNVAFKGTSMVGDRGNDRFIFSHFGIHFDLFSDPSTRTVELLYADVAFDPLFYGDEDGDFVLDPADRCVGTPYGVAVDTLGCPLDSDRDGVPDYIDEEPDTGEGNWVNEKGITMTEEAFYASIQNRETAMKRADVGAYLELIEGRYEIISYGEIPDRFKPLDADQDGYLSFDELLKAIDEYFDFKLDLTLEELRAVNEFFFSQ